jgi:hypothetical protein
MPKPDLKEMGTVRALLGLEPRICRPAIRDEETTEEQDDHVTDLEAEQREMDRAAGWE